MGGKGPI